MESIGQILKAARECRQISIADVVAATKMTSTFVKAIEANDFDTLVAPVYARGFIKLYAGCVGLDPMPLLRQFDVSNRAAPALTLPPSKAPPGAEPIAYAEKLKPKPEQEKSGGRSKAVGGVALAKAAPLRASALVAIPDQVPASLVSLVAGRLPALSRLFCAHVKWPRFKLPVRPACNAVRQPAALRAAMWAGSTVCLHSLRDSVAGAAGRISQYFPLPVIVWRRFFIVTLVVLLIIAASLAWEWSYRGLPSTTDACRWLAEPPAPYLTMEARAPTPGR